MKIENGKAKVKIILEYFKRNPINWDSIYPERNNLAVKVSLKDGRSFYANEIESITIKVKEEN